MHATSPMLVSDGYTFHSEPNMRCDTDIQHLRRYCSCWTQTMEQSSIAPERGGLIVQ